MPEPDDAQRSAAHLPAPGVQRGQFGATERRTADKDSRPPSSSTELRTKGPADFADRAQPRINWLVFVSASAIILAFSVWAILTPHVAAGTMNLAVDWISVNLGWFYVLTITLTILFVLWVAFSKEGGVRLGPDHSRPQYNLFTWVSMLFAAGVGIDMLFYSVTGPVTQYIAPPSVTPESAEAAQDAVIWTMFHYGIAGWSVYALLGMAMGTSPTAGACRCRSARRCTRCSASASGAGWATRSMSSPSSAPSSASPPRWASAWSC